MFDFKNFVPMHDSIKEKGRFKSVCILCHKDYTWSMYNFYNLCDECFSKFDKLKMNGRLGKGPECETIEQFKKLIEIKKEQVMSEKDYIELPRNFSRIPDPENFRIQILEERVAVLEKAVISLLEPVVEERTRKSICEFIEKENVK
jgi:hypothetical protein